MSRQGQIVVFDGQSLNNYPTTGLTFPYLAMEGRNVPWVNVAISGQSWTDLAALPERVDRWAKNWNRSILVMTGGSTDILDGDTPATVLADAESYADDRRTAGFDIVVCATIPPGSLITNSGNEADRLAANGLLLASDAWDYTVDICVEPLLDYTDLTYWEADENHWNATGALTGYPLYSEVLDLALA